MARKVIITCAVTGNGPLNPKHPAFPITPTQIAEACVEAASAGAAIVHVHVRNPETGVGSREPALFKEVVDRVRQKNSDVLINLTCGLGGLFLPDPQNEARGLPESDVATPENRMLHLDQCLPDLASLDITTANMVEGSLEFVFLNTTRTLRAMARHYQELGVKPEVEVYGAGDILFGNKLLEEGLLDDRPLFQMVMGLRWGAPPSTETILYQRGLLPKQAIWAAFGLASSEMPMAAQSVLLGGNVRVGLEDNLYLSRGVFATNGQLVERAASLVNFLGESVATPAEAREALGIVLRQK